MAIDDVLKKLVSRPANRAGIDAAVWLLVQIAPEAQ